MNYPPALTPEETSRVETHFQRYLLQKNPHFGQNAVQFNTLLQNIDAKVRDPKFREDAKIYGKNVRPLKGPVIKRYLLLNEISARLCAFDVSLLEYGRRGVRYRMALEIYASAGFTSRRRKEKDSFSSKTSQVITPEQSMASSCPQLSQQLTSDPNQLHQPQQVPDQKQHQSSTPGHKIMSYCLQQPQQQIHPQNDSSLWFDPNQSYPAQSVTIEGHQQPTANPLTYGHDHFTETEPKSKQVILPSSSANDDDMADEDPSDFDSTFEYENGTPALKPQVGHQHFSETILSGELHSNAQIGGQLGQNLRPRGIKTGGPLPQIEVAYNDFFSPGRNNLQDFNNTGGSEHTIEQFSDLIQINPAQHSLNNNHPTNIMCSQPNVAQTQSMGQALAYPPQTTQQPYCTLPNTFEELINPDSLGQQNSIQSSSHFNNPSARTLNQHGQARSNSNEGFMYGNLNVASVGNLWNTLGSKTTRKALSGSKVSKKKRKTSSSAKPTGSSNWSGIGTACRPASLDVVFSGLNPSMLNLRRENLPEGSSNFALGKDEDLVVPFPLEQKQPLSAEMKMGNRIVFNLLPNGLWSADAEYTRMSLEELNLAKSELKSLQSLTGTHISMIDQVIHSRARQN